MRGDVQLARGRDEILGVVGLVRAYGDATLAAFLLLLKHQQRGLALGVAVGLGHHGGGDQAVAVLHQSVSQIGQMRLLAVALLVQPRVRVGGRFMRVYRFLLDLIPGCQIDLVSMTVQCLSTEHPRFTSVRLPGAYLTSHPRRFPDRSPPGSLPKPHLHNYGLFYRASGYEANQLSHLFTVAGQWKQWWPLARHIAPPTNSTRSQEVVHS